ncbi:unnamed protein product [Owenia fusiformis]|uniref:Coiled-coil domain-containing protein n=1 Tax=Owenia fusiformis TaxID=6347 RepID=A0A8J1XV91_OWEFU|nr:unnamed protein product [Owenia fusiformis]
MPKKFKGENTKAVAARERRSAAEEQRKAKKQQEEDDAYWKDDDKDAAKKQKRKEDKEKKRLDLLQKKLESQRLLDEEESSLHSAKPAPSAKVTRAQIEHNKREVQRKQAEAKQETKAPVHDEVPLEENVNRLVPEEGEARTVEDAIQVLSAKESLEKHPEKRVKAAYASYESERLPKLKQENPNMRLSQLKQILKKDWMKSPDNPLNQRTASYNTKLH